MEKKIDIIGNDDNLRSEDFYQKFKEELEKIHTFPTDYLFKFIVPADQSTIAQIYAVFENSGANISTRDSSNGKYTSITAKVSVHDANDVVIYYKQVSAIKGVVML